MPDSDHHFGMQRCVEPEWLDELSPTDPRAARSRLDLQRVNAWMGSAGFMARLLRARCGGTPVLRIIDLGAGDGTFALHLARRLAPLWPGVEITLLDRQRLISTAVVDAYADLGWKAFTAQMDVLDWLKREAQDQSDLVIANLFLHHFDDKTLQEILRCIASRTSFFLSCDPRRNSLARLGAWLLWTIGCNAVTRHDAVISVAAGFAGQELSSLWPKEAKWNLREMKAGLFSHCLFAERV